MYILRYFLFPFSLIYWTVTTVRNVLFDWGIFKSYTFITPIIAVGNLSVGGTGKTPQIEYLIRLLSGKYKIATLSRGYKRKSKGYILASPQTSVDDLGDEPFQFKTKFKQIDVAVDADRKNGIENLLNIKNKPDVILLDDAYQHRKVKAKAYILLTAYYNLFTDDFLLPVGSLRESKSGVNRASVVVVTKCPSEISEEQKMRIKLKVGKYTKAPVFFSTINYDNFYHNDKNTVNTASLKNESKLIIAGIAKPDSFFDYFRKNDSCKNEYLSFPDHHNFTKSDIQTIVEKAKQKTIITTEKDYMRLKPLFDSSQLFYLPIKMKFIENESEFNELILQMI